MTKTTEELKREMYKVLASLDRKTLLAETGKLQRGESATYEMQFFQCVLESYLEALCKELKNSHEATGELAIQLHEMTAERDELRNKLQIFELANKTAGDLLRDALATVKRQRQFIRTLYTSRKTRKVVGGTSCQKKQGNVLESKCGGSASVSEEISTIKCMHTTDFDGVCTFCRKKVGGVE